MKKKYFYNGKYYTYEQMNEFATQSKLSFDDYVKELGENVKAFDAPYEYNGKHFTETEMGEFAKQSNLKLDDYLKEIGLKKKESGGNASASEAPSTSKTYNNLSGDVLDWKAKPLAKPNQQKSKINYLSGDALDRDIKLRKGLSLSNPVSSGKGILGAPDKKKVLGKELTDQDLFDAKVEVEANEIKNDINKLGEYRDKRNQELDDELGSLTESRVKANAEVVKDAFRGYDDIQEETKVELEDVVGKQNSIISKKKELNDSINSQAAVTITKSYIQKGVTDPQKIGRDIWSFADPKLKAKLDEAGVLFHSPLQEAKFEKAGIDALKGVAELEGKKEIKSIAEDYEKDFADRHPEYYAHELREKLAKAISDAGDESPLWFGYNEATLRKALNNIPDVTETDRKVFEKSILPIEKRIVGTEIPTGGFTKSLALNFEKGLTGISNTVADFVGLRSDMDRAQELLNDSDQRFRTPDTDNPVKWLLNGTGTLTGQVFAIASPTKVLRGLQVAQKPAIFISGYLSSLDEYRKTALDLFPDDERKRILYANTMAGLEGGLEGIFDDTKIFKAFTSGVAPNVADITKRFINKQITREVAQAELRQTLRGRLGTFLKETGKSMNENGMEEGILEAFDGVAQSVYGGKTPEVEKIIGNALKTYAVSALHSGLVSGMAGVGKVREMKSSDAAMMASMVDMGKNPIPYLQAAEDLWQKGEITKEQYDEKVGIINKAAEAFKKVPEGSTEEQATEKVVDEVAKAEQEKTQIIENAKTIISNLPDNTYTVALKEAVDADPLNLQLKVYLKNIAEQLNDEQSAETTRKVFGEELSNLALKLYPDARTESTKPNIETSTADIPTNDEGAVGESNNGEQANTSGSGEGVGNEGAVEQAPSQTTKGYFYGTHKFTDDKKGDSIWQVNEDGTVDILEGKERNAVGVFAKMKELYDVEEYQSSGQDATDFKILSKPVVSVKENGEIEVVKKGAITYAKEAAPQQETVSPAETKPTTAPKPKAEEANSQSSKLQNSKVVQPVKSVKDINVGDKVSWNGEAFKVVSKDGGKFDLVKIAAKPNEPLHKVKGAELSDKEFEGKIISGENVAPVQKSEPFTEHEQEKKNEQPAKTEPVKEAPKAEQPKKENTKQLKVNDLIDRIASFNKSAKNKKGRSEELNTIRLKANELGLQFDYDARSGTGVLRNENGNLVQKRNNDTASKAAQNFDVNNYSDETKSYVELSTNEPDALVGLPIVGNDGRTLSATQIRAALKSIKDGKPNNGAKAIYDYVENAVKEGEIEVQDKTTGQAAKVPVNEYFEVFETPAKELTDDEIDQLNWELSEESFNLNNELDEQESVYTEAKPTPTSTTVASEEKPAPTKPSADANTKETPKEEVKKETPKAGDAARKLADKIRSGKISKLGGFKSGGFDAIWDASLEVVASAIEAGASVADAIQSGLAYVKKTDWYKNLSNKEEFDKKYQEHLSAEYSGIGITHADTSAIRDAHDFGEYVKIAEEIDAWDAKAKEKIANGEMDSLLTKLRAGKYADISAVEQRMMGFYIADLSQKAASNPTAENLNKLKEAVELNDQIGSQSGKALRARQGLFDADESLGGQYLRRAQAEGVDELTPEMKADVEAKFAELERAKKEADEKLAEAEKKNAELQAKLTIAENKKFASRAKKKDFKSERQDIKDAIREKLRKSRGQANSVTTAIVDFAKIAPDVIKLMKSYVEEGITEFKEIVAKIHADVKDLDDNITEKDVIDILAGKYDTPKPTKADLEQQLKAIKDKASAEAIRIKAKIESGDFSKKPAPKKALDNPEFKKQFPELYKQTLDALVAKDKAKHELALANLKAEKAKRNKLSKGLGHTSKAMRTIKAVYAGIDLSMIGVQNLLAILSNPIKGSVAIKDSLADLFSPKRFERELARMHQAEWWGLVEASGLRVLDPNALKESERSDIFNDTYWDDLNIKHKGKKVNIAPTKPFERAFTSLGNHLRVSIFLSRAAQLQEQGKTYDTHPKEYELIAEVINNMTGQGEISKELSKTTEAMSWVFWSPRLMASSINMLGIGDVTTPLISSGKRGGMYTNILTSEQKLWAARQIGGGIGMGIMLMLAYVYGKRAMGEDDEEVFIETDPRSTTFGMVKDGDKSWAIFGRYTGVVKTIAMLWTGERKNGKGVVEKLNDGYSAPTKMEVLGKWFRGKANPMLGAGLSAVTGQDYSGAETDAIKEVKKMVLPMSFQEWAKGFGRGAAASLGITVDDVNDFFEENTFDSEAYIDGKKRVMTNDEYQIFAKRRKEIAETKVKLLQKHGAYVVNGEKIEQKPYDAMTEEEVKKQVDVIYLQSTKQAKEEQFGKQAKDKKEAKLERKASKLNKMLYSETIEPEPEENEEEE